FLLRRLPDAGYAFAKPLSLLLGGYIFWLSLSLHILPNRPGSAVLAFMIVAAASGVIIKLRGEEIRAALRERLALIIMIEALFALSFVLGVYLRSFIPEIVGTEKPMDFAFLNAA